MEKEMVKIKANLVNNVKVTSFYNNDKVVTVANFSLVKKYGRGKEYINCAYYNDDMRDIEDFYKGDLIYVYGYFNEKEKDGKVYKNFIVKSVSKIVNKSEVEEVVEECE